MKPRLLALILGSLLALGPVGAPGALANSQPATSDRVQVISVAAHPSAPGSDAIAFETTVDYALATAPRGFIMVFFFEDAAETSTQQGANAYWVDAGAGRAVLRTDYVPRADTRELTVLVALFRDESTLLSWSVTNAFSLAPWPARAAFASAMAARLAGQHQEAVSYLSKALEQDPQTALFHYWRADSLVRLGQYDAAIADYTQALAALPSHRASLVGRGVAYLWKGDWGSATADLTSVLDQQGAVDQWTALALHARGLARAGLGHVAEAIADYQAYLSLSPTAADRAEVEASIAHLRTLESAQTVPDAAERSAVALEGRAY